MFCLRRYIIFPTTTTPPLPIPINPPIRPLPRTQRNQKQQANPSQLAPPPLHPHQRLPPLHHLLRHPNLHPPPTLHLLLRPASHPLHLLLPLVRPLFLRSPRRLVRPALPGPVRRRLHIPPDRGGERHLPRRICSRHAEHDDQGPRRCCGRGGAAPAAAGGVDGHRAGVVEEFAWTARVDVAVCGCQGAVIEWVFG